MKEIKTIIKAYDSINRAETKAALATVVRVEGSSYRRTGARMLVTDDGVWVGGISGGCLEGDALKRARMAISRSEASLITYDTTQDDAHQIGVGLGCNGIIDVLFTPLQYQDKNNPVEILKTCLAPSRQTNVLVTITGLEGQWTSVKAGQVIKYTGSDSLTGFSDARFEKELNDKIIAQSATGKSAPMEFELPGGRGIGVFTEILLPDIHLVLMGHQYDVYPLARLAKEIGYLVTMVSNPLKMNSKFAETDAVAGYHQIEELIDEFTAIVLMAHDYNTDKSNLTKVLQTEAFYIGMLGPRVRSEKIFNELAAEGYSLSNDKMDVIYAPAGLDIGALSPEEIALSIIAEIKTVFSKRQGGSLKFRHAPIHERS